jgi:hypothetical protein
MGVGHDEIPWRDRKTRRQPLGDRVERRAQRLLNRLACRIFVVLESTLRGEIDPTTAAWDERDPVVPQ